jgi:hypothetical protein
MAANGLKGEGMGMSTVPKRVDPAFWLDAGAGGAVAVTEERAWRQSDTITLELPKVGERTRVEPRPIAVAVVRSLVRSERGLSFLLMTAFSITLAIVSAAATSTAIAARDNRLALESMKTRVGILQKTLEDARNQQTNEAGFAGDSLAPIEWGNVVWVPLRQER